MLVILGIIIVFFIVMIFSLLRVSSIESRFEEEMERNMKDKNN